MIKVPRSSGAGARGLAAPQRVKRGGRAEFRARFAFLRSASAFLFFLLPALGTLDAQRVQGQGAYHDPHQYYNLYSNTPRIRIVPTAPELYPVQDSDEQYRILSHFSNDFVLLGSAFYDSAASGTRMVGSRGAVSVLYKDIPQVARLDLAYVQRGLNTASLTFKEEIAVPIWAESIEFWGHGAGNRHGYRLVYRDEEGQQYTMDFGMTAHYGWKRFAAAIPMRANSLLNFAQRYRKLFITELIVLDDYAVGARISIIHVTNLAVSRMRRTLENQAEFWMYTTSLAFDSGESNLEVRALGYTNLRARVEADASPALRGADPPIANVFAVDADYLAWGLHRIILRFPQAIAARGCRKIILTLRGEGRGERISLFVRNAQDEYYLLRLGAVSYQGWQKISVDVPPWVVAPRKQSPFDARHALNLLELIIEPGEDAPLHTQKEGIHLALGRFGVVEDRGSFVPTLEISGW